MLAEYPGNVLVFLHGSGVTAFGMEKLLAKCVESPPFPVVLPSAPMQIYRSFNFFEPKGKFWLGLMVQSNRFGIRGLSWTYKASMKTLMALIIWLKSSTS